MTPEQIVEAVLGPDPAEGRSWDDLMIVSAKGVEARSILDKSIEWRRSRRAILESLMMKPPQEPRNSTYTARGDV